MFRREGADISESFFRDSRVEIAGAYSFFDHGRIERPLCMIGLDKRLVAQSRQLRYDAILWTGCDRKHCPSTRLHPPNHRSSLPIGRQPCGVFIDAVDVEAVSPMEKRTVSEHSVDMFRGFRVRMLLPFLNFPHLSVPRERVDFWRTSHYGRCIRPD